MTLTLGQAIRNAVETERAGAAFYRTLVREIESGPARALFAGLADEEDQHAEALERRGRELGDAFTVELPDPAARTLEGAPAWVHEYGTTLDQAFEIALEAEEYAELYYSTLADVTGAKVQAFFLDMARREQAHAERLRRLRTEILG